MPNKRVRPKVRKHLGKKNPKIDVYDEWEHGDMDRDEAELRMKGREKRWKEIEAAQKAARKLEKKAIDEVEKMKRDTKGRPMTPIEEAWLRCDFILSHIMDVKAYAFMENIRIKDPKCYKWLYKRFMSKNMMVNAQMYVDFFAKGGVAPYAKVSYGAMIKAYKKYKGIRSTIKVVHKGEEEREL